MGNYFSFSGRIGGWTWLKRCIVAGMIGGIVGAIAVAVLGAVIGGLILAVLILVPSLALSTQRLRDMGAPILPAFAVMFAVPIIDGIFIAKAWGEPSAFGNIFALISLVAFVAIPSGALGDGGGAGSVVTAAFDEVARARQASANPRAAGVSATGQAVVRPAPAKPRGGSPRPQGFGRRGAISR